VDRYSLEFTNRRALSVADGSNLEGDCRSIGVPDAARRSARSRRFHRLDPIGTRPELAPRTEREGRLAILAGPNRAKVLRLRDSERPAFARKRSADSHSLRAEQPAKGIGLWWSSKFRHIDRIFCCHVPLVDGGRQIAQNRMQMFAVVEADDVDGDIDSCFGMVGIFPLPYPFHFEIQEEAFGSSVDAPMSSGHRRNMQVSGY
jgi:hypothetical protein